MLLFLIRHADPIYSPDGLTPLGIRQAEALAKRLSLYGIDKIYSSDSNRAIMTAKPTSERTKKGITILNWCNEGLARQEFNAINSDGSCDWIFRCDKTRNILLSPEVRKLEFKWYEHSAFSDLKCKDGMMRIDKNTDEFLKELGYVHDRENALYQTDLPSSEHVALFAHGGFGIAFLTSVLDIPYPQLASHFSFGHSGFTVINFDGKKDIIPQVLSFSNDSHLYKDGLPTKWCNSIYF